MRLLWTERAVEDLEAIESYVAHDSPNAAAALVDEIVARAEGLLEHPRRGRIVPEVANPDVREIIVGNYRVVYRLQGKDLQMLQVFEGHRLLPEF